MGEVIHSPAFGERLLYFLLSVQFALVRYSTQLFAFALSKGYQITVPSCTFFGHRFVRVPSSPKGLQEGGATPTAVCGLQAGKKLFR